MSEGGLAESLVLQFSLSCLSGDAMCSRNCFQSRYQSVSASCEIHLWYRAVNLLRADFVAKQLLYPLEKKTNTQVLVLEAPRTRLVGCCRGAGSVTEKVPVGWIGHPARGAAVKIYHGVVLLCEPEQALQQFLLLSCSCSMNPRLKAVVWLSVALADC